MTYEWLAGFFDGEGCITISKSKKRVSYYLLISIGQKKIGILREIVEFLGYGKITHCGKGKYQVPSLYFTGDNATSLLKNLLPYLKVKYLQAKMAIYFQEKREDGRGRRRISKEQMRWRELCKQVISSLKYNVI